MKIENNISTVNIGVGESPVSSTRSGQKTAEMATLSEGIQLSAGLRDIEKNLASSEVFDVGRVEQIKQAISEGRFTVNHEKVADGLLDTVRGLINGRQS